MSADSQAISTLDLQREGARSALAQQPGRNHLTGELVRIEPDTEPLPKYVLGKVRRSIRHWLWKRRLHSLGLKSQIVPPAWFFGAESIKIGERVRIWQFARIEAINPGRQVVRVEIGDGTAIQPFVHIGAIRSVRIGKGCLFASHAYITDHDHDFSNPREPVIENDRVIADPVEIGDYVWMGERVMVLKGVKIGERSIIGAGSIVTRDVPPLSIAVGSPARVIRRWNERSQSWDRVES